MNKSKPNSSAWWEYTWNPIVGCSKISAGCANCYAERMAKRVLASLESQSRRAFLRAMFLFDEYPTGDTLPAYFKAVTVLGGWTGQTALIESELDAPSRLRRPAVIFCGSMGDTFHPTVSDQDIDRVLDIVIRSPRHFFIFCTKRPERMKQFRFWHNCMVLTSAENQECLNRRWPELARVEGTAGLGLSVEPMLGPVRLLDGFRKPDWVICGPETGPRARNFESVWAATLSVQCSIGGIPYFDKRKNLIFGGNAYVPKRQFPRPILDFFARRGFGLHGAEMEK